MIRNRELLSRRLTIACQGKYPALFIYVLYLRKLKIFSLLKFFKYYLVFIPHISVQNHLHRVRKEDMCNLPAIHFPHIHNCRFCISIQ